MRAGMASHTTRVAVRAKRERQMTMDRLTLFGLFAVTAMLVCYALEDRSRWFILAFAAACALGSAYGFLQGAWPFGLVEAVWAVVALRRWSVRQRHIA
jgi:CHASE2 domain-containing sensor protein